MMIERNLFELSVAVRMRLTRSQTEVGGVFQSVVNISGLKLLTWSQASLPSRASRMLAMFKALRKPTISDRICLLSSATTTFMR